MAKSHEAKGELKLEVRAESSTVHVRVIGVIYGEWVEDSFRRSIDEALSKGSKNIAIYINTRGGDCFIANEMSNIMHDFKRETGGSIIGRGGAIVASAGTQLAVECDKFTQARNGQFMLHKPWGRVEGTADQIESGVQLLRNLENQYAEGYAKKSGKTAEEIKALYEKGDYWLTAKQAKEQGFIDGVDGDEEITEETVAMYAACGRPAPIGVVATPKSTQSNQQKDKMEFEMFAVALALLPDASKAEVLAEINRLRKVEGDYKALKLQQDSAKAEARKTKIDTVLSAAVENMQIHADAKGMMKTRLEAASVEGETKFNEVVAEIEAMPAAKSLGSTVTKKPLDLGGGSPVAADRASWTFKKWNDEDPEGLEALAKRGKEGDAEAKAAYLSLFNAEHKTNYSEIPG